jgi:hypothetical protein
LTNDTADYYFLINKIEKKKGKKRMFTGWSWACYSRPTVFKKDFVQGSYYTFGVEDEEGYQLVEEAGSDRMHKCISSVFCMEIKR